MTAISSHNKSALSPRSMSRGSMLIGVILMGNALCFAQSTSPTETGSAPGTQPGTQSTSNQNPLTNDERAELLKLIRTLQERVDRLEAAQAAKPTSAAQPKPLTPAQSLEAKPDPATQDDPHVWMAPVVKERPPSEAGDTDSYGRYSPNLGFKVANTEYGDLSISIYTYARYLNQRALHST